jgi:hypothetical protein
MVMGPVVPTCTYNTELAATGINCRIAAGRDTLLDILGEDEYRIAVAELQSKVNVYVPEPTGRVKKSPTMVTPPPQTNLYQ